MSRGKKLSDEDCKKIAELIDQGHQIKDLADKYDVHISVIYRRCKGLYDSRKVPVEIRNKVIKAIKQGYTKAEAAQLYGLNIGTVYNFTRNIEGSILQGYHVLRKNGIKLLQRLLSDGYLLSNFNVPVVRNLQEKFPVIRSARYTRIKLSFIFLEGKK